MNRLQIFARDEYRCVYCGLPFDVSQLSLDHVQPRMRGGDASAGNVVTACTGCNTRKGGQPLAMFLRHHADARRNFFQHARYVWARHLIAVAEELVRRGVIDASPDFVEEIRGLRSSSAIAASCSRALGNASPGEVQGNTEGE